MTAVRRLYEVSARMGAGRSLSETLQAVVDGVVDGLGFGIAVLNLRQADGKFEVIAVAGSPDAREALLGTISAADIFDAEFAIADSWGALRFVPHERLPEGEVVGWVPEIPVSEDPDAWHPLDALFAPLKSPSGELVGMLSVDLPEDQRRPGQIHRELLEIFATQAGLAIDKARLTDQLLAEKVRLEASETTFRLVFQGAGNGMATIAFDPPDPGRVLRVNEAFCRITGYAPDQLIGTSFPSYLDDEDFGQTQREIEELTQTGNEPYRFERRFLRADGRAIWLAGTASIVDQGKDQPRFILVQVDDVTARKDAERELEHNAAHDPLTGLPNRRLLRHRFNAALQRCRQTGSRGAVLFCDLDHFKDVNDRYGHETGDRALREIADRLLAQVRHGDTVARLGGDEFAILAEDISGDALDLLVERLDEAIASPLTDIDVPVTASIGTGIVSPYVTDLDELLRTADDAMYQAKRRKARR
ncbi:diguanylate cyclase [Kribbella sp. NBC_01245]|uniref:diguanylate cyclase domain-containing protein n=1 Tax=Kribbella sp. NBC_01245 TaxID=2903578 RepID=UPI002E28D488|nr:diguanylate cyclase [Kribbella sp. NBC_01245]